MFSHRTLAELGALALAVGLGAWFGPVGHSRKSAEKSQQATVAGAHAEPARRDAPARDAQRPPSAPLVPSLEPVALHPDASAPDDLARRSGDVPKNIEAIDEFRRRVAERAEATASLVHSPRDLDRVLVEIDGDIERSQQVNAFHVKSGVAAIRAAYRERPEDELEARLLEFDHKLTELSAKYDPRVREELAAGAARHSPN